MKRFSWPAGFVLGFTFLLQACDVPAQTDTVAEPRPAKLLKLNEESKQASNSFPAVIRSVRSTDLAFQVGGEITTWKALGGEFYRKGSVIAGLDPRSFRNAVTQAEAQYRNADSEYQRALRLIKEDAISQSVVESRLAQRQVAQATLDDARKSLADTVLRAPFSGFIGKTYVEQFQNVQPQAPVVTMQSSAVEAIVNVPGSFVLNSNKINYYNTFVELDAAPGRRFPAVFREATGQADQSTQTFEGRFSFQPPADLVVLTGMTATLSFDYDLDGRGADGIAGISIPLASVVTEGSKKYVWVVKPVERSVARREVQLADQVGQNVIATKGLKVGETIVASGGAYLRKGDRVRPWKR
ncbi:efflux RND transporter periplasmic adaptor subunit [Sphingorhabdus sp. EL138]|uniref:efflux RND transporter periplasmic adaptor subunit n=1 Tax=Sphingorhabdus sp. EL138 TaxID=2073156 RepID=UPI0013A56E74|nr:efflux RND transporter periplasmic adaptor subunit [Sphingorhabdus sp. EL138]